MVVLHARARLVTAVAAAVLIVAGCSEPPAPPARVDAPAQLRPPMPPVAAQPRLPADPAELVAGLVADERTLHHQASAPQWQEAARRQQLAYRLLSRHPEWDPVTRTRVPPDLREVYDRNIDARRQLSAMGGGKPTLPAWHIIEPPTLELLMSCYRAAQAATGVGWNYLAAINLVETAFGRIRGVSSAGAQGPMQFLPSTFAQYGQGGDIRSPRDAIMAAGRFLAAHGFATDRDAALYRYNNSTRYVRAITDYAAVMAADPAALRTYHRWDVYYNSTAGDVLLPVGYRADAPIPVQQYLKDNPQ
ncbi:lytic murein transglycosylase [Mycolicibacterium tokaiense]|uniref:lytic transglycosylase domain-containing protein n=1 Tax=Mycolicibacterium tokaiense TaxID=39695 RepID=UPI003F4967AA